MATLMCDVLVFPNFDFTRCIREWADIQVQKLGTRRSSLHGVSAGLVISPLCSLDSCVLVAVSFRAGYVSREYIA